MVHQHTSLIPYTLVSSKRARRARITVKAEGEVVVTVPWRLRNDRRIDRFVEEKALWIQKAIAKMQARSTNSGEAAREGKVNWPTFTQSKDEALAFVIQRVQALNGAYGYAYARICVRNQKTRWGSCSKRGNLNFNYRLLFLPPHLADYVIVHELCHLVQMNHSVKFWQLVGRTVPNHRELRRELKSFSFIG